MPNSSRKPDPRQFFSKHTYIHDGLRPKIRDPPVAYPEPRTPNHYHISTHHDTTMRDSGWGIREAGIGNRDSVVGGSTRRRGVALHQVRTLIPVSRFPKHDSCSPYHDSCSRFPLPLSIFLIIEKRFDCAGQKSISLRWPQNAI